ncbi:hypothetical protein RF11_00764 [Thelohanellus kitauei]|uniref:Uncharacterized protein n=1 Tax=Thelohanellus kitauei TaxID=669202 RepID=A0A0C2J0L3_THEKT|nr:hypothetical protein RF11_00764 [Thelohanellus kitauei]
MFVEISLSRTTAAHAIETVEYDDSSPQKKRIPSFQLYSLILNESTDFDDSGEKLEITEEFLRMESAKDATIGKGIFEYVENPLYKNCSQYLGGKNHGLMRRLNDRVGEVNFNKIYVAHRITVTVRFEVKVDLFEHMKVSNTKRQGNGIFADEIDSTLSHDIITHFQKQENMALQTTSLEKYINMISAIDDEFTLHFGVSQQKLIDLQCNPTLKEKFQSKTIEKFYVSLNEFKFLNSGTIPRKYLFC